jgi:hypothetical protein
MEYKLLITWKRNNFINKTLCYKSKMELKNMPLKLPDKWGVKTPWPPKYEPDEYGCVKCINRFKKLGKKGNEKICPICDVKESFLRKREESDPINQWKPPDETKKACSDCEGSGIR